MLSFYTPYFFEEIIKRNINLELVIGRPGKVPVIIIVTNIVTNIYGSSRNLASNIKQIQENWLTSILPKTIRKPTL